MLLTADSKKEGAPIARRGCSDSKKEGAPIARRYARAGAARNRSGDRSSKMGEIDEEEIQDVREPEQQEIEAEIDLRRWER